MYCTYIKSMSPNPRVLVLCLSYVFLNMETLLWFYLIKTFAIYHVFGVNCTSTERTFPLHDSKKNVTISHLITICLRSALKDGYESDSTLVFRKQSERRPENRNITEAYRQVSPFNLTAWYLYHFAYRPIFGIDVYSCISRPLLSVFDER